MAEGGHMGRERPRVGVGHAVTFAGHGGILYGHALRHSWEHFCAVRFDEVRDACAEAAVVGVI